MVTNAQGRYSDLNLNPNMLDMESGSFLDQVYMMTYSRGSDSTGMSNRNPTACRVVMHSMSIHR
jgi:hypothetical protein